jgi:hypothetical protein
VYINPISKGSDVRLDIKKAIIGGSTPEILSQVEGGLKILQ